MKGDRRSWTWYGERLLDQSALCGYGSDGADTPHPVAYYSRYLEWFEVGRTEYLRDMGWPYRRMEEQAGTNTVRVFLPVVEAYVRFHKPARYDDRVAVCTSIREVSRARMQIEYEVGRKEHLLASGYAVHAFVDCARKPIRSPSAFVEALRR